MGQGGQSGWGGQVAWAAEVVELVRVDWAVRVVRDVKPGCYAFRKIYGLQKRERKVKMSCVLYQHSHCTDIHVKLDRFPPRFHHCLAELEHGKYYIN